MAMLLESIPSSICARSFPVSMTTRAKICLLAGLFIICAVGAILTHLTQIQAENAFDPRPLYGVIVAQFQAWKSDDLIKAYQQASRRTQERFTSVQYLSKIRIEYSRIPGPIQIEFGRISLDHQRASVPVYFMAAGDQVTPAKFILVKENGNWRIENFEVFDSWPLGQRFSGTRV